MGFGKESTNLELNCTPILCSILSLPMPAFSVVTIVGFIILGLNLVFVVEWSESARRNGYALSLLLLLVLMSKWIIIWFGVPDACSPRL